MEKHTEFGLSNPDEIHFCLQFEGLVARLCIVAFGGEVWKQIGLITVS